MPYGEVSMSTCFVMQPFDGGPFDRRYKDVFAPAIKAAGLEPYRVHQARVGAISAAHCAVLLSIRGAWTEREFDCGSAGYGFA